MNRNEAAFLLGVPVTADPETVRHAWRIWARIAHPDVDGDPAHFAQLDEARRVLLQTVPALASVITYAPRKTWSQVVRKPAHPVALALSGIATILLAALAGLSPLPYAAAADTPRSAAADSVGVLVLLAPHAESASAIPAIAAAATADRTSIDPPWFASCCWDSIAGVTMWQGTGCCSGSPSLRESLPQVFGVLAPGDQANPLASLR